MNSNEISMQTGSEIHHEVQRILAGTKNKDAVTINEVVRRLREIADMVNWQGEYAYTSRSSAEAIQCRKCRRPTHRVATTDGYCLTCA